MFKLNAVITLICSLSLTAAGSVYEPFDYSTGTFNDGTAATGSGLAGNWTCGAAGSIVSGLSYTGLPVADNALQSSFARQYVSLGSPLSSATKWISFLYQTSSANPGGNINGVYFPNGNSDSLWFGFGLSPYSATQGQLGLGSVSTSGSNATGATPLEFLGLGTYGDTYLVVLKIDFDTAGSDDTVTVYLNPIANQDTPGVAPAGTHSNFDVGSISGVGLNVTGAGSITVDEIRIGNTYAEAISAVTAPPDAPTGLTALAGTNRVSLSWNAATGLPASYNIKRSVSFGGPYATIGTVDIPAVTFEDDVLGGQTYYYVVSAVNIMGEGSNSTSVSSMPILVAPDAPTGLSAVPGDSQVELSWTGSAFATGYTVKRAADIAGPYTPVGTTVDPVVLFTDTNGLMNAITYFYAVSATGAGGSSPDSEPVSSTPFGPMPFVLNLQQGAGVVWFASNNVAYQVQWASEDLGTNTVWHNHGEMITGNGETNTVFDATGTPHNHYRVISIR